MGGGERISVSGRLGWARVPVGIRVGGGPFLWSREAFGAVLQEDCCEIGSQAGGRPHGAHEGPAQVDAAVRGAGEGPQGQLEAVLPSTTSARAPTGAEHPASRAARTARSAVTQARASASSRAASTALTSVSSSRHSTARAPCPGAGSIWRGSMVSVMSPSRPRRARPARASTTASTAPEATRPIRVSTFPRMSLNSRPSPRAASWATRRASRCRRPRRPGAPRG